MQIIYLLLKLGAIVLCAWLWRMGGYKQSLWRNPGVGIVMGVTYAVTSQSVIPLLFIPAFWAVIQAFSYGVNAPIHVLWCRLFGYSINTGNDKGVEFCTRVTCAMLWSLPVLLFGLPLSVWIVSSITRAILVGVIAIYADDAEFSERGVGLIYSSVILL